MDFPFSLFANFLCLPTHIIVICCCKANYPKLWSLRQWTLITSHSFWKWRIQGWLHWGLGLRVSWIKLAGATVFWSLARWESATRLTHRTAGRRPRFFAEWAPHSASNDRTADISKSKWSEREKAVLVTYCCIINHPKLQTTFGFSRCLWTRNLGLSKGDNPGVGWNCRPHILRLWSLTWDASSTTLTQLSVGLSSLTRGPRHQAASVIRAGKQDGSHSHL